MPDFSSTPHRSVRVIGRPDSGAVDPATGRRAHGGICFYDGGEEVRANPGDVVNMPASAAASYLADGLVADPSAFTPAPEPEPVLDDTDLGFDIDFDSEDD